MNGNNPYAGAPGVVGAGQPSADLELSPEQKRALRRAVAGIVAQTRTYLPDGYAIGSQLSQGASGPTATVAVEPPVGHAVSAGFSPDFDDLDTGLSEDDRAEVARGLAASAALQVMSAVDDEELLSTAR